MWERGKELLLLLLLKEAAAAECHACAALEGVVRALGLRAQQVCMNG